MMTEEGEKWVSEKFSRAYANPEYSSAPIDQAEFWIRTFCAELDNMPEGEDFRFCYSKLKRKYLGEKA